jgi:CBS domain-containing protein
MSDEKGLNSLQAHATRAKVSEIPAKDIMHRSVVVVRQGSKIYSAVQTLTAHRISGAPVVDNSDRLIGVVSEYDLLLQTATKDVLEPIEFTRNPIAATPEMPLREILIIFYKKKIRWMPVVAPDRKVEGIITRLDVLNKLLSRGK